jgi:hypothetical protein
MPEIDHRIGQGLECVVDLTEAVEAKQQAPEPVFPSEHSVDRAWIKDGLLLELS